MKMNTKMTGAGGILSAFFSSVCCVGPFIFTALGIGTGATGFLAGVAGFTKALIPYRPLFIGLIFAVGDGVHLGLLEEGRMLPDRFTLRTPCHKENKNCLMDRHRAGRDVHAYPVFIGDRLLKNKGRMRDDDKNIENKLFIIHCFFPAVGFDGSFNGQSGLGRRGRTPSKGCSED
jgi:hypothetical protein